MITHVNSGPAWEARVLCQRK